MVVELGGKGRLQPPPVRRVPFFSLAFLTHLTLFPCCKDAEKSLPEVPDGYVSANDLAKIPIRIWDRELCRCYINTYPIGSVIEHRNRYYVGYGWRNVMDPTALNPSSSRVNDLFVFI